MPDQVWISRLQSSYTTEKLGLNKYKKWQGKVPVTVVKTYWKSVSRKFGKLFGPEIKYSNRNIKNKSAGPG